MEEIGKMECFSAQFIAALHRLLESDTPIVATVGKTGGGFITEVKLRGDCPLWEVTHANREVISQRVLAWLETVS